MLFLLKKKTSFRLLELTQSCSFFLQYRKRLKTVQDKNSGILFNRVFVEHLNLTCVVLNYMFKLSDVESQPSMNQCLFTSFTAAKVFILVPVCCSVLCCMLFLSALCKANNRLNCINPVFRTRCLFFRHRQNIAQ